MSYCQFGEVLVVFGLSLFPVVRTDLYILNSPTKSYIYSPILYDNVLCCTIPLLLLLLIFCLPDIVS